MIYTLSASPAFRAATRRIHARAQVQPGRFARLCAAWRELMASPIESADEVLWCVCLGLIGGAMAAAVTLLTAWLLSFWLPS